MLQPLTNRQGPVIMQTSYQGNGLKVVFVRDSDTIRR